ncbi:HBS1-like protein [Nilaparvata lugens]|uniref:HBS1-like protein n=1 Tax=Nilaparvata lugens TaxID=108931 RepID=UPI00193DEBB5|nr:HBS1-like protein [Nilaparvata lugens]
MFVWRVSQWSIRQLCGLHVEDVPTVIPGLKREESYGVSTPSPSIKVAAVQSKSSTVVKGFDVPSSNKTANTPSNKADACNLKTGETNRSLSQSPEPERKPQSSVVIGDKDSVQKTPHSNRSAKAEEEWKKRCSSGGKEQLHMVTIGHVDAGKSTLMGHLLYRLGHVNQKTMHKYEQESKKMGKQSFVYAWILDETGEERSRGITMDVGQSQIETTSKCVTLLDAPGHKDFIPNMITGAAQADVALLVVDATRGEFETGFESGGQTREHALLVRSLGVNQLCVAVNKLDTVSWSEGRFKEVVGKMQSFLKQAGFRDSDVTYVPCSGLTGENLTAPPSATCEQLSSWYKGPCLLDVIDRFKCPERPVSKPFRLSINDIFKGTGSGFCVSGRVETGMVQQGDKLLVQPLNETGTVKALYIDDVSVQSAFAGDYVNVTLSNIDQQNMAIGYILSDPLLPAPVTCKIEARIVIFNITVPITSGFPVVLHQQSLVEPAVIVKLVAQLHKSSGEVVKRRPRCLLRNTTALVIIETSRPICVELYRNIKELGRLMLRSAGTTIAAGLVTKIL